MSPSAQRALYQLRVHAGPERAQTEALLRAYAAREQLSLQDVAERDPSVDQHDSPPASLAVLTRVEDALLEARELSAQFREAAALRVLVGVEQELLGALDVPGAHAFLAEVYVQIGLCAALLGEQGLAETSLTRALSLDPSRRVEAAEAPPLTLALARRIAGRHDVLATSENPLQITPANTTLWLDGAPVEGSVLRARAGLHLVVAAAPGHQAYASLLTLEPGRRGALRIALAPSPEEEARRALAAGPELAEQGRAGQGARALRLAAATGLPVLLVEAGAQGRALLQRCEAQPRGRTAESCLLIGLEPGATRARHFTSEPAAHSWLHTPKAMVDTAPGRSSWKRWPVWVASAALLAAGVVTLVVVRDESSTRRQRELEIDPGEPPP